MFVDDSFAMIAIISLAFKVFIAKIAACRAGVRMRRYMLLNTSGIEGLVAYRTIGKNFLIFVHLLNMTLQVLLHSKSKYTIWPRALERLNVLVESKVNRQSFIHLRLYFSCMCFTMAC